MVNFNGNDQIISRTKANITMHFIHIYTIYYNKIITSCQCCAYGKRSEGFLLLEVLTTLLIMTVFFGVFMYWQGLIITWRSDALERLHAITLIRSTCERCDIDKDLIAKQGTQEGSIKLTWQQKNISIPIEFLNAFSFTEDSLPSLPLLWMEARWKGFDGKLQTIRVITSVSYDG
jgi:hypothetical protein